MNYLNIKSIGNEGYLNDSFIISLKGKQRFTKRKVKKWFQINPMCEHIMVETIRNDKVVKVSRCHGSNMYLDYVQHAVEPFTTFLKPVKDLAQAPAKHIYAIDSHVSVEPSQGHFRTATIDSISKDKKKIYILLNKEAIPFSLRKNERYVRVGDDMERGIYLTRYMSPEPLMAADIQNQEE